MEPEMEDKTLELMVRRAPPLPPPPPLPLTQLAGMAEATRGLRSTGLRGEVEEKGGEGVVWGAPGSEGGPEIIAVFGPERLI